MPCIHWLTTFAQALGTENRLEDISTAILIQSFEIEYSRSHIDQTGQKLRSVYIWALEQNTSVIVF